MAVDPANPNRLTIGWRQFDNVSSNFRQAGWGFITDNDRDGIIDDCDNCPATANPRQIDSNNNEIGNACNNLVFGDGFEWGSDAAWSAVTS